MGFEWDTAERDALAHCPDATGRGTGLLAIYAGFGGDQFGDGRAAPGDQDLFALLHPVEQRAEPVLGFEGADFSFITSPR